jgi:aminoglycoside phosphotransferase (APT) family kinase protein
VHSDLHEGNIVCTETGAAFLDFGCAFMGVPLWDYAALAFFLGWSITERVLVTGALYRSDDVRLVALSFALYRWESSAQDPEEAQHCAAFIREMLDLA